VSDDIVIRIRTLLDKASPADIDKVKSDIEQRVNPKIKIDVDTKNLDKVSEKFEQAQGSVGGITQKTKEWSDALHETVKQTEYFKAGSDEIQKRVIETTINYKKQRDELAKINAETIKNAQNKNFNEAKQHLTQLNKLRQEYHRLESKDTEQAKELTKQISYHQGQYNNIIRRKIDIGEKTKIEGIETEKLNQLEKIREQTLRNISNIKSKNIDKDVFQQQKQVDDFNKRNINSIDYQIRQREIEAKQFSKALQAKMQQEVQEKNITTEIQKQSIAQQKMLNTIRGMRGMSGAFIVGDNLKDLNDLENKIKGFNPADKNFAQNMRNAKLELDKINTSMGIYKKEVQDANKFTGIFGQSIFEAGKKFASWLFIGNVIMGVVRVIRNGIQYVVELDNAMNQLQIVMNLNSEQAIELSKNYNTLAKEMSVTTTEIAKAAVEFARQGLSLEQMDDRLRNTIKYAKISGMEFQEAAEIITASVNSMGVETQRVIDIFSYMGDATATGADEIGRALQRVGGTAGALNVSFEKLSSWIAVISSRTRESAESIGNSMKTILARMQNMSSYGFDEESGDSVNYVSKALATIGVQLMDSEGQFRNLGIVMDEIGAKWNSLDSRQKAYIATMMAGVRQQSRFLNLMEGYADSVKLYEESLSAAGTANQKFEIWQDSSQAKLEKFQATLQTIYQSSFDSGLIKDIITFATELLDVIVKLQEEGRLLTTTVGLLSTAFFIFHANASKSFYTGLMSILGAILKVDTSLKTMRTTMTLTEIATVKLSKAVNVLNTAFNRFLPALILTGLVYVIQKIVELRKEAEETEKSFKESISAFSNKQNEIDNLKKLSQQYDELNSKVIKNAEEEQNLINIKNNIAQACEELGISYDVEGNAIINNSEQIKKYIKLKEQQLDLDRKVINETYDTERKSSLDNIKSEQEEIKKLERQLKNVEISKEAYLKNGFDYDSREIIALDKRIKELSKSLGEHRTSLFNASKSYDDLNLALLNSNSKFLELDNTIKSNIIATFNKLSESKKNLNFKDFIEEVDTDVLKSYQDALSIFKIDGNIEDLTESFDKLQQSLIETALKFTKNKEVALEVANTFLKLQDPIGYAQVSLSKFQSAIQTVASATTISTKSIISAFSILGISINKEVASILSGYMGLVAGIQSVADAHNVIVKIVNDITEGGKTTGMADTTHKTSLVITPLVNLGKYYDELKAIQDSLKTINNFTGGGSSGSSFQKTFEVWEESLNAINSELETLKDQLDDVNSFEQKTEIYDQMILLLEKKQNLLSDINNTFDSSLRQAEQNLRSYIGKGLSESDFNKIISGSTDTIEVDIKNDKIAKAIEDFKKLKDSAEGLKKEIQGIDDEIRELSFAEVSIKLSIEDTKLADLTQEKQNLRNEMSLLEKGSQEYIALLTQENQINIESINILRNKIALVQQELASDRYNADQKKELIDILKQLKQEYVNLQFSIKQELASMADEIIQIYKNIYEKQKKLALDAIDEQMKAEEKRHKQATDNLDDELKQFEYYINARIKALDRAENEHDYNRDLEKKQKARQELLDKIGLLSMDDSMEAKLELAELNKQLAQQEDEINEMQHNRSVDLRKDNLKDQLDAYKKDIDAKKKTEDTKLNLEKDRLDRIKKETERHYDELINDERKFSKIKTDIINGNINEVKNAFGSFKTFVNSNLEFIGNSITANLITKMEQAMAVLQSYQSQSSSIPNIPDESFTGGNNTGGNNTGGAKTGLVKPGMLLTEAAAIAGVSVVYHSEDNTVTIGNLPTRFPPTGIGGTHLNSQNRIVIDEIENIKRLLKMAGGDVSKFHDGGVVGSESFGFVDKFNKFFNTSANEHIIKALTNEILIPPKNIERYLIPNMQKLIANVTPQLQFAGGGNTNYYLNLRIDNVTGDKRGGETVFKEVVRGLKSIGK